MAANGSSSSRALPAVSAANPFSLEAIRAQRAERFPEIGQAGLSRRERKIYQQAREDCLAIGLTRVKAEFAVRETAALEAVATERFLTTTAAIAQRLRQFEAACPDEQFQVMGTVFAVEGVKRMGGAIAAMVDVAEQQIDETVERSLALGEQASLLGRLFSGRR
jgi:hypothetical protein